MSNARSQPLSAALVALAASQAVGVEPLTGPIVNPANGHTYIALEDSTWTDAQSVAVSLGGHLVTVNDQEENDWLAETFTTLDGVSRGLWIGFTDADEEGVWRWVSGEPVTFLNWAPGEPNNAGANEDFGSLAPTNHAIPERREKWNDVPDGNGRGVVEIPPPPCPADLNEDREVNGADLGLLLSLWGDPDPVLPADLNGDGAVDGADLGLLLAAWGGCP